MQFLRDAATLVAAIAASIGLPLGAETIRIMLQ